MCFGHQCELQGPIENTTPTIYLADTLPREGVMAQVNITIEPEVAWNPGLPIHIGGFEIILEGPSTQYFRTLVPKPTKGMVFETRVLDYRVLRPSDYG